MSPQFCWLIRRTSQTELRHLCHSKVLCAQSLDIPYTFTPCEERLGKLREKPVQVLILIIDANAALIEALILSLNLRLQKYH